MAVNPVRIACHSSRHWNSSPDIYNSSKPYREWLHNPAGSAGSLTVHITPGEAAAVVRWRVDGGGWQTSGATVGGLAAGAHTVSFSPFSGWDVPADATVSIAAGNNTTITRTYVRQTGNLKVTIGPSEAAAGGARWRRAGTSTWRTSGSTETGIPTGSYTVEYNTVSGWDTPANASVSITKGNTTANTGTYVRQKGGLKVTIGPADAPGAGARWRRTGTTTWRTSGSTETGIPAGTHAVEFNALAGPWVKPGNINVSITKNATNALSARYNRPPVLADPGSHFTHVGAALDFAVTASDPDGDGVTLVVSNAPAGGSLSSSGGTGTFHFVAAPAQAGQLLAPVFKATESHGGLTDSKSASIQVGAPPTVAPLSNRVVVVSNVVSFTVSASDPENESKTFGMSNAPAGAILTGTGNVRTFSYTAVQGDAGQTFTITFTATDADGTGSRVMSLQVKSPPVFNPMDPQRVRAGSLLVRAIEASDPDGDAMHFLVSGRPVSAHFTPHPAGVIFAYFPVAAEIGRTYDVQFHGIDVDGTRILTVPITVIGPDDPLTDYDPYCWGTLDGFGGSSAGATLRNFAAGAQGQPVGRSASGTRQNSGGFLVPEPGAAERAAFAAQRTVQGVPYAWLAAYGLTNQPWDEAAAAEHGNGMTAWESWVAGTDPTNPATAFRVEAVEPANGRVRVALRTVPGRRYTFSGATNLAAPNWQPLDYGLIPDGALTNGPLEASAERTDIYLPAGAQPLFIRSQVQAP